MAGELLAVPVAEFGLEAYAIDLLDDVAEVRLRIMDRLVVDAWPDLFENESEKESCLEIPDLRLELLLEVSLDRGEQAALDLSLQLDRHIALLLSLPRSRNVSTSPARLMVAKIQPATKTGDQIPLCVVVPHPEWTRAGWRRHHRSVARRPGLGPPEFAD